MLIRELLHEAISDWERLGHPALMERFVLRNGTHYPPGKRVGRRGKPKECYANSTDFVVRERYKHYPNDYHPTYVEGFMVSADIPILIPHGWVTMNGYQAMDLTVDSDGRQYFGVPFPTSDLIREVMKNRVYGILDTGRGLNHELMFSIDPALRDICNDVLNRRRERLTKGVFHD